MKAGDLRQFYHHLEQDLRGKLFLVVSTRQTLCDFLVDGKLQRNYDVLFVKHNSRVIDESG